MGKVVFVKGLQQLGIEPLQLEPVAHKHRVQALGQLPVLLWDRLHIPALDRVDEFHHHVARHGHKVLARVFEALLELEHIPVHLPAGVADQRLHVLAGVRLLIAPTAESSDRALPYARAPESQLILG